MPGPDRWGAQIPTHHRTHSRPEPPGFIVYCPWLDFMHRYEYTLNSVLRTWLAEHLSWSPRVDPVWEQKLTGDSGRLQTKAFRLERVI